MARPFILLGDKTDHGGVVITASGNTSTNGKGIACVGDRVTCPRSGHGGTTVIVTGDPNVIIDGRAAESAGLVWGGRWKMMDLGHVELRRPGVLGKRPAQQ